MTVLDDAIEYRGCKIAARVKRLQNGKFRAERVITPINEKALAAMGGVPRLCCAVDVVSDATDSEASALRKTVSAGKAFVNMLYETSR